MKRVVRGTVALLVLALSAIPAWGDAATGVDPNNARGFNQNVFQLGDFDNVNVFNGNLVVRIPIGQAYNSGPILSYQLGLTANSKVWDFEDKPEGVPQKHITHAIPERVSNAGLGWILSMGRLLEPRAAAGNVDGTNWIFIGSDGAQHEFFATLRSADPHGSGSIGFTNDNSYLRLKLDVTVDANGSYHEVESPDGLVYEFFSPTDTPANDLPTQLRRIHDRFDNWVKVEYGTIACDSGQCDKWTITDGFGDDNTSRTHTVKFKNKSGLYNQQNFQQVVDTIDLQAFNGSRAQYVFHYADDPTPTVASQIRRDGCGEPIAEESDPNVIYYAKAPLLQSITLPDGSSFVMTANTSGGKCASGALGSLTLPTRGRIKWDYGSYEMPMKNCDPMAGSDFWTVEYGGVVGRTLYKPDSETAEGIWSYHPEITPRSEWVSTRCGATGGPEYPVTYPPRELKNTVTNPAGDQTVHYFSIYPRDTNIGDPYFKGEEYGLPITRADQLETGGRALSTAVYDCAAGGCTGGETPQRKTYLEYENDGVTVGYVDRNSRVKRQRVTNEQDTGCGAACYVDTDFTDFDGYGHYRKSTVKSNFPSSIDHVTFTNFNAGSSSTGKDASNGEYFGEDDLWILGTYNFSWVQEGTSAAKTQYDFDASTGALKSSRILKSSLVPPATDPKDIATSSNDLLTVYCRDTSTTAGTRGFITSERLFGGDKTAIPAGDLCAATRGEGQYFNDSAFTFSGANLTKRTSGWADSGFLSADVDLDLSTGLVKASRDSSELSTTYAYDSQGRITEVHPPGQGWTLYTYAPASTPPKVSVQVWPESVTIANTSSPETNSLKDDYYYYNGVGRVIQSKSRLPDDGTTKRWATSNILYDAAGRIHTVSMPQVKNVAAFENFTPTQSTVNSYDLFGRILAVTAPDNTVQSTAYTGDRVRTNSRTDDAGTRQRSVEKYDGRGRLVKVTEPSGATSSTNPTGSDVTTTYSYDMADRLAKVSMAGPVTQERIFTYDNRGWLAQEQHPEKGVSGNGTVVFSNFDAAGKPWTRTEGSIVTKFTYDSAERLTDVKDGADQAIKSFMFASANGTGNAKKGKLETATRFNRVTSGTFKVTETYTYGEIGGRVSTRETKVERETSPGTYATIKTFSQTMGYEDGFGLPDLITYPTCSGCPAGGVTSIGQDFKKGLLATVTNFATLKYGPTGMLTQLKRTTPVTSIDDYAEDRGMARPSSITFSGLSTCTSPDEPQFNAPSSVCPSSTGNQATVSNQVSGLTYQWTITGGTITSGQALSTVTFTAGASGNVTLMVTATKTCSASAVSPVRSIPITGPTATVTAPPPIARGQCANLSIALTGTPNWTLNWADGATQSNLSTSPATRNVCPQVTTTYSLTSVGDATCTVPSSSSATVTVYPPSPAWINAYANTTNIAVTWAAATGAVSYVVERAPTRGGPFQQIATTNSSTLGYNDPVVATSTAMTYVYRVRTKDSANTLSQTAGSPIDFATSFAFTDASLANDWDVKGIHVSDLQKAVDAFRAASQLGSLFTNAPSLVDADIAASDFTAVINALNAARTIWGLSSFTYSGLSTPAADDPNSWVDLRHVTQLREAVR